MKTLPIIKTEENKERDIISCPSCKKELDKQLVVMRKYVCYECGYYFRVRAKNRIRMVADEGSFIPWFEEESTGNPLDFPGYEDKIIMAGGTFIEGSTIELSADGPLRQPYTAYMQGGLTYSNIKIALEKILDNNSIKNY